MSNSKKKMEVYAKKMPQFGGKRWVFVKLLRNMGFVPSFEDLFRIIQAICFCEDEKYPTGKGRIMVQEFLIDCCQKDTTWEAVAQKYRIPIRCGTLITKTNGANVQESETT